MLKINQIQREKKMSETSLQSTEAYIVIVVLALGRLLDCHVRVH